MESGLYLVEFVGLLLFNIAAGALGFIPSLLITPINLDRFGLVGGSVLSVAGEIFGALAGFWLYRYGATQLSMRYRNHRFFLFFRSQKPRAVFFSVLGLRLMPFVPSGVVTAGAALTALSAPAFFIASSIGKLPAVALEIAVAFGLTLWLPRPWLYALLGVAATMLAGFALIQKRRKLAVPPKEKPESL